MTITRMRCLNNNLLRCIGLHVQNCCIVLRWRCNTQMNANTMLVENEGLSAIHLASMLGHMGCVHLLVSTVQSVDARDDVSQNFI